MTRCRSRCVSLLAVASLLATVPAAWAQRRQQDQQRPGIGYVYPAGGRQGTTLQITLGGQNLDGVDGAIVSGTGVHASLVEDMQMTGQQAKGLRERLRELQKQRNMSDATKQEIAAIEKKLSIFSGIGRGASRAIAHQVVVEVTLAADAKPGAREIRLRTPRGVTNPLAFHVGQVPEFAAPPALPGARQTLGREEESLRRRTLHEELRVTLPCAVNGQITFGAIDRCRFQACKGQRLVISAQARQLIPYIADAVPGWFQAVLALYDAQGKEVAYDDDYRFQPDPVIFYEVPRDGEYVLAVYDALYRGREDFVYRITVGELPFVTSIFPLGGPAGATTTVALKGWNLPAASLTLDNRHELPGVYPVSARTQRWVSNVVPFAVDTLPECLEHEPNNSPATAQRVTLPIIVNGRIDRPGDADVFRFQGRAGEAIVAEVSARRLDSPLDSVLKLTDAAGKQLAYNDDQEDKTSALNTHDADSYLSATLPENGTYYLHLGDTQRHGGEEYAYRLRISAPQGDFALRVVPSSVGMPGRGRAALGVYVFRKEGFAGDINLELRDPPPGFSMEPVRLSGTEEMVEVRLKTDLTETEEPVGLSIVGRATVAGREVVRQAVPAEDKMQAFAYHHLVPAQELKVVVLKPPAPFKPFRSKPVKPK